MRYYQPKKSEFVLENTWNCPIELIGVWKAKSGERKSFKTGEIALYIDDYSYCKVYDFINIGCMAFAVEVDGKRYQYHERTYDPIIVNL